MKREILVLGVAGLAAFAVFAGIFVTQRSAGAQLVGDANCDGIVNPIDAALILQFDARIVGSLGCPAKADVNGDGTANALDAVVILQYSAGIIHSLPPSGATPTPTRTRTPTYTASPTLTPTTTPTNTPTLTITNSPSPTANATPTETPDRRQPFWVDCRVICASVLAPAVSCAQTPPGGTSSVSDIYCVAPGAGWEANCSTSGPFAPRIDCLHSRDGFFSCEPSPRQTSGSCQGDTWSGACSRLSSSELHVEDVHCWGTDDLGTETVDCVITYGNPADSYACEWQEGGVSFTCERRYIEGLFDCRPVLNP